MGSQTQCSYKTVLTKNSLYFNIQYIQYPPNNEAQYTEPLRVDYYIFFGARDLGFGDTFCPISYKVGFWYFKGLCIRDTVSNKTYQNFRDKRLVRPGSKYLI